jgi:hypothetical protein
MRDSRRSIKRALDAANRGNKPIPTWSLCTMTFAGSFLAAALGTYLVCFL